MEQEEIAWPAPDVASGGDPELAKILYTAQVAEVAEQRNNPIAREDSTNSDILWVVAFVVCVIATIGVTMREGGADPDVAGAATSGSA